MFSSVRSSLGSNNNPTVNQFKCALRKIVLGATLTSSLNQNCTIQDNTSILLPVDQSSNNSYFEEQFDLEELEDSPSEIYIESLNHKSVYRSSVINYIAGFIQRKISRKEQCVFCKLYLSNLKVVCSGTLLNQKNRGWLTKPAETVELTVRIVDTLYNRLREETKEDFFKERNLVLKLSNQTSRVIHDLHPTIFSGLDDHVDVGGSHRSLLITNIVGCYVTLRSRHLCRELNNNRVSLRQKLTKLVTFKNQ